MTLPSGEPLHPGSQFPLIGIAGDLGSMDIAPIHFGAILT
jgi:hypothetical protein